LSSGTLGEFVFVRSFFFFQAEDGIRDGHVTGVQTCALPICSLSRRTSRPTVGGRNGPLLAASQRSSLARVVLRGAAPFRKLRNPFGETPTSRAARRNETRAACRATASRSRGMGRDGTVCFIPLPSPFPPPLPPTAPPARGSSPARSPRRGCSR